MILASEDFKYLSQFEDDAKWIEEAIKLECLHFQAIGYVELGVCNRSPKTNWIERKGGLPPMVNRIVRHLVEKGMSCGHAIAVAINAVKKGAATGDLNWKGQQHMRADHRANYATAAAQWQALKAG